MYNSAEDNKTDSDLPKCSLAEQRYNALPHGRWYLDEYITIFYSYSQAANQGFLSKSQWAKRKRQPQPECPKAIVVTESKLVYGWSGLDYLVIERIDNLTDRVVSAGYEVIHKDHTVPVKKKSSKTNKADQLKETSLQSHGSKGLSGVSSTNHLQDKEQERSLEESIVQSPNSVHSSSISLTNNQSPVISPIRVNTSIDRRRVDERSVSVEETRAFSIIKPHEKCLNKLGCFVPKNFSKEDEVRLGDLLEQAYYVFHHLHLFRVIRRLPKDAWIDLHYDYFDRRLPDWRKLRPILLDGIVEKTEVEEFPVLDIVLPRGSKGHRCYGYRFADEAYRNATVRKRPITDPKLIEVIESQRNVKYPVQRWLEKNLQQIEMADVPDERLLEIAVGEDDPQVRYYTYKEQVQLLQDKSWIFVADDFARRIHTNLTQLKRELRADLRIAGQPLVQIDIKNSQPLFIGLAARKYGVEDQRYLELCQGDLYQHLADQGGWTRGEVKEQLTQAALFAANGSPHQRLPVKRLFDQEFPKMARFIRDMKSDRKTTENPKPHNKLARLAQKTEAHFLIYGGVCERIRRERPDCWIGTIHDSLLVLPENAEYVRGVMLDDFGKMGVQPRLEIEACDR